MATKLGKLIRDPALVPALPRRATVAQTADRDARIGFLLVRAKIALALNPSWRGAAADDVSPVGVPLLTAALDTEVKAAATKIATLTKAMADPAVTDLLPIDDANIDPAKRFRRRYMSILGRSPQQLRDAAIISAGWTTLIRQPAITDADLHSLVSRRLMTAERMLWYVGRPESRDWSFTAGKEWQDSWNRMFEYPRLPAAQPFSGLCKAPTGSTTCLATGQMNGWEKRFGGQFRHDLQLNPTANPRWKRANEFFLKQPGDPMPAVRDLFTPSKRFDQRNFLMCDHVIDALHLEALARVKSKRDGNTTWFKAITDVESDGWLRIIHPSLVDDDPGGVAFLVGEREPRFFERKKIPVDELEVGDHVIVYNHPAYDKAKEAVDVWRLENALVVTTSPRLMLQGHGTNPLPFTSTRTIPVKDKATLEQSMRLNMLGLFNRKLNQLRRAAVAENAKSAPRATIDDFDSDAQLVQRTDTGPFSGYDLSEFSAPLKKLARWWIRWDQDSEQSEHLISSDPDWAQQTWDKHRVELLGFKGFFPLWLPRLDAASRPVRKAGKISALQEVTVSQKMASGWSWYYAKGESPDDSAPHRVAARRPKVS